MAAITFNTAQRTSERLEAMLMAVGERVDPSLGHQMRLAAAETGPGRAPPNEVASSTTLFGPLDTNIVSDAIPASFIGRNRDGFWVAREAKGRIGGIFLFKTSAVSFAKAESEPMGCVTIFPTERFELDLKNNGNPLYPYLRPFMRLALNLQQRALASWHRPRSLRQPADAAE